MDEYCAESQEVVTRCRKKLEALGNKLDVQRATLRNLRRMAKDLSPLMEGIKGPEDMPLEFQKQLNDTLREIEGITESMRPSKPQPRSTRRHGMV